MVDIMKPLIWMYRMMTIIKRPTTKTTVDPFLIKKSISVRSYKAFTSIYRTIRNKRLFYFGRSDKLHWKLVNIFSSASICKLNLRKQSGTYFTTIKNCHFLKKKDPCFISENIKLDIRCW